MKHICIAAYCIGLLTAGITSAEHLKKKSVLFRGNFGYGWVSGGAAGETEENIADGTGWVISIPIPGGGTRTEPIRYGFQGMQGNLEATYMLDKQRGAGGYFRYRGINQGLVTSQDTDNPAAVAFMSLNCFGPQLLLYKPLPGQFDLLATVVLGIARGEIHRIAYVDRYIDDPLNDGRYAWYSEPVKTAGMHFGVEGALVKIWFNGFCADVSLRYDMYYLTIQQERTTLNIIGSGSYTYPETSVHGSIGIGVGIGFASLLTKKMPR